MEGLTRMAGKGSSDFEKGKKQVPFGNDRKKGKSNGNS
jgi:hypothetical protein